MKHASRSSTVTSIAGPILKCAMVLTGAIGALLPVSSFAQTPIAPHPVTDINPLGANSDPADVHQVNNKVFFTATDHRGRGLFVKTLARAQVTHKPAVDARTVTLTHFQPGIDPDQFVVTGMQDLSFAHAKLFFHVPDLGLYTSGGTALTTKLLKKVDLGGPGMGSLAPYKNDTRYSTNFSAMRLFFAGDVKNKGNQLFISNGTATGTHPLNLGIADLRPYGMVDCNGTLFFGDTGFDSTILWKTDGTVAGTDGVDSGGTPTPLTTNPEQMTASNIGGCFFSCSTQITQQRDLFYSNGTLAGTVALTSTGTFPAHLTPFGGGMILSASDSVNNEELWYADNTQAYQLNDINPLGNSVPDHLVNAGDEFVYFTAYDSFARKLYRTNGTPSSLTEIKDGSGNSMVDVPEIVPVMIIFNGNQTLGDTVYFTTGADHALWSVKNSDGNAVAAPVLTAQSHQITNATHLAKFVDNGIYRLYFTSDGEGTEFAGKGTELWVVGEDL